MPPRLSTFRAWSALRTASSHPPRVYTPFVIQPQQCRAASILSSLSDNPGAYNKRIRRGRGPASGKGKTSGRGHKGQKQHGKVPRGFNGGQTPIEVVHGKRGFENQLSLEMSPLNVDRLQDWINQGRIDPLKPITMKELNDSRCLHGVKDGVKLLARGSDKLTSPINIIVSRASAAAIAAVEAAGGKVTTRYYAPHAIRRVLRGQSDPLSFLGKRRSDPQSAATTDAAVGLVLPKEQYPLKLSDPTARKAIEYYRDSAHRGYMRHTVKRREGPSLFFKTPGSGKKRQDVPAAVAGGQKISRSENRIW